jgi:hypothetical protein
MIKRAIASAVVAGTLLAGIVESTPAYANTATATAGSVSKPSGSGEQLLKSWLEKHRVEIRRQVIAISAKSIGVTKKSLVGELRSGKSIAEVAVEHNVTADSVVSALVTAAEGKVGAELTAGKITSAEAGKIDAALPAYAAKLVARVS